MSPSSKGLNPSAKRPHASERDAEKSLPPFEESHYSESDQPGKSAIRLITDRQEAKEFKNAAMMPVFDNHAIEAKVFATHNQT